MNRRILITALIGLPTAARAHSYKLGVIAVGHAWVLPTQQTDGQLFFPMVNNGNEPEELIAARSSICTLIELRSNNRYDDPALASMVLEPGKPLAMRPTARHLRLMGLERPLNIGDRFPVILDFLKQGEVEIAAHVEAAPGE